MIGSHDWNRTWRLRARQKFGRKVMQMIVSMQVSKTVRRKQLPVIAVQDRIVVRRVKRRLTGTGSAGRKCCRVADRAAQRSRLICRNTGQFGQHASAGTGKPKETGSKSTTGRSSITGRVFGAGRSGRTWRTSNATSAATTARLISNRALQQIHSQSNHDQRIKRYVRDAMRFQCRAICPLNAPRFDLEFA